MEPHGAQVQKQIEKNGTLQESIFDINAIFSRDINKSLPDSASTFVFASIS